MSEINKVALFFVLLALAVGCQSNTGVKQMLSNMDSRKQIMVNISKDTTMINDMIEIMMNNDDSKVMLLGNDKMTMMMMENHGAMIRLMKRDPDMMKSLMTEMMDACKSDSVLSSLISKSIKDNPQMIQMMNKITGDILDLNKVKNIIN